MSSAHTNTVALADTDVDTVAVADIRARVIARINTLLLLLALAVPQTANADADVPYLTGRINDYANLISPDTEGRLDAQLSQLETEKGNQVVVLTIDSLQGEVLEDYTIRVAETWKLGRSEFDDGALLLIVKNDRKMRIEVGYGLEPTLTDVKSKRILDNIITPKFRAGDFDGGIASGVDAIERVVRGSELPIPSSQGSSDANTIGFLLFQWFMIFVSSLFAVAFGPIIFVFYLALTFAGWTEINLLWGPTVAAVCTVLWSIIIAILWFITRKCRKRITSSSSWPSNWSSFNSWSGWFSSSGSWSSGGGGFSGGGGGFSGGGGGFSGGGGGFGGGGASGGW